MLGDKISFHCLLTTCNLMSQHTLSYAPMSTQTTIAQLVELPLSELEVVDSNPKTAPYQRCKNGTTSSLADAREKSGCARKIE